MAKRRNKVFTFQVDEGLREQIEKAALREGVSYSHLIRESVRMHLGTAGPIQVQAVPKVSSLAVGIYFLMDRGGTNKIRMGWTTSLKSPTWLGLGDVRPILLKAVISNRALVDHFLYRFRHLATVKAGKRVWFPADPELLAAIEALPGERRIPAPVPTLPKGRDRVLV